MVYLNALHWDGNNLASFAKLYNINKTHTLAETCEL